MSEEAACKNCNYKFEPSYDYCPKCGQEAGLKADSFVDFVGHFLKDYFTFDNKIFNSVKPLLMKPGFLTNEFIIGRRARYISPVRLYLFISILFFLLLGWLGGSSTQVVANTDDWDHFFESYLPKLFFVLLPLFALVLHLLFIRNKRSYVVHFVHAIHFHSFVFFSTSLYLAISALLENFNFGNLNLIVLLPFLLGFVFYLLVSMKQVYGQAWGKIVLKTVLLLLLYGGIAFVSMVIAFLILPGILSP